MKGMSLDLDSIASMGRFPKFCVDTYRWGDRFFNSYDTVYVKGTGYNMNVKIRSNNWFDYNNLYFAPNGNIEMSSPTTNTIGVDVTYMAVSLGYDLNINKLFGGSDRTKSKFNFDFACALLSASFYSIKNDIGMNITEYDGENVDKLKFSGVSTCEWGVKVNYFFNNKRYSYAAAFSLSRLQQRSQGSFSLGLSYVNQKYKFDFSQLPRGLDYTGPDKYGIRGQSLGIKIGYGYNWVPRQNITLGISESVVPALVIGSSVEYSRRCSFRLSNHLNVSFVWNHDRWFLGVVGKNDIAFIYDDKSALANGLFSTEVKFGWRFRL
jgi:hypothetical protein